MAWRLFDVRLRPMNTTALGTLHRVIIFSGDALVVTDITPFTMIGLHSMVLPASPDFHVYFVGVLREVGCYVHTPMLTGPGRKGRRICFRSPRVASFGDRMGSASVRRSPLAR